MPVIKVKMRWEEGTDEAKHFVIKFKVPKKWKPGPVQKIKETFVDSYNKKHGPAHTLELESVHLVCSSGKILYDEDVIEANVSAHADIRVKPGEFFSACGGPRPRDFTWLDRHAITNLPWKVLPRKRPSCSAHAICGNRFA